MLCTHPGYLYIFFFPLFEDLGQFCQSLKETSKDSQAVNHISCLEEGNGEEKGGEAMLFELSPNGGQAHGEKWGFRN